MNPNEVTQRFVQSYFNLYQHRIVATKKQFCDAVGLYTTNLNLMQRGERQCTIAHVCNLFTKYGVNPEWLFTGSGAFFANGDN